MKSLVTTQLNYAKQSLQKISLISLKISSDLRCQCFGAVLPTQPLEGQCQNSIFNIYSGRFNHIRDLTKRIRLITITTSPKTSRPKFYTEFHCQKVYKPPPPSLLGSYYKLYTFQRLFLIKLKLNAPKIYKYTYIK